MELVVKTSLANLYSEPKFNSEMISQALLWEKVKILDNFDNWYKIKQWDNYESWVHEFYLTKINSRTLNNYYTVSERIQWVYSTPKKDSLILGEILFGTELPIKNRHKIIFIVASLIFIIRKIQFKLLNVYSLLFISC